MELKDIDFTKKPNKHYETTLQDYLNHAYMKVWMNIKDLKDTDKILVISPLTSYLRIEKDISKFRKGDVTATIKELEKVITC